MGFDTQTLNKEYQLIRNEIDQKITLHNTLLTFTITTTVAILAIAIKGENSNAFLFLLPFCVIIPMSNRIAYYREAMTKLSSYLIVFCESQPNTIQWETRNFEFYKSVHGEKKGRKFVLNYYECLVLSLICYALFLFYYIPSIDLGIISVINCLWPIILVIWEFQITRKTNRLDKEKENVVNIWEKVKAKSNISNSECSIDTPEPSSSHSTFVETTNGSGQ